MKLIEANIGEKYKIINFDLENKRLASLGFRVGAEVIVLFKNKCSVVVSVLGSCYALAPKSAENIIVLRG